MTMTDPDGDVSIKCDDSFGADVSDAMTIRTVYAGPHSLVSVVGDGETKHMSGMWPPWGRPSLISASEISQVEKDRRVRVEDILRLNRMLSAGSRRNISHGNQPRPPVRYQQPADHARYPKLPPLGF